MGFPWRKLASVGLGVAGMFIPGLQTAVAVVEENLGDLSGPDKKKAAIAIAKSLVETAEGAAGKDLVNDPVVAQATSELVDAIVGFKDAEAKVVQAIETAKKARGTQKPQSAAGPV